MEIEKVEDWEQRGLFAIRMEASSGGVDTCGERKEGPTIAITSCPEGRYGGYNWKNLLRIRRIELESGIGYVFEV